MRAVRHAVLSASHNKYKLATSAHQSRPSVLSACRFATPQDHLLEAASNYGSTVSLRQPDTELCGGHLDSGIMFANKILVTLQK